MRFQALDSWRGVAALMVVIYHAPLLWSFYDAGIVRHSWLFVDFFFVLSGFVIEHAYASKLRDMTDVGHFMLRRFGRVWPLHAAMLLALVLIQCLVLAISMRMGAITESAPPFAGPWSPAVLPAHLLLMHALGFTPGPGTWNTPSWSISVEFYTYFVFALTTVASGGRLKWIAPLAALVGFAVVALMSRTYLAATTDWGLARCIYGFFVGVFVAELRPTRFPALGTTAASALELTAIALVVAFVNWVGASPLSLAAPLAFAIAIFVFAREGGVASRLLKRRAFTFVGEHSYSIYMVHLTLILLLQYAAKTVERVTRWKISALAPDVERVDLGGGHKVVLSFGSTGAADLALLALLVIVLFFSYWTYRAIERPARDWVNRLSAQRSALATKSALTE